MRSKHLKSYNIPSDQMSLSYIDAKPNFIFLILFVVGAILLVNRNNYLYGTVILLSSIIGGFFLPRTILMVFYQDYLIMYNRADKDYCALLYYDEIVSWSYIRNRKNEYLSVELIDGSNETINGFSKTIFERNMKRFLKDKQKKVN